MNHKDYAQVKHDETSYIDFLDIQSSSVLLPLHVILSSDGLWTSVRAYDYLEKDMIVQGSKIFVFSAFQLLTKEECCNSAGGVLSVRSSVSLLCEQEQFMVSDYHAVLSINQKNQCQLDMVIHSVENLEGHVSRKLMSKLGHLQFILSPEMKHHELKACAKKLRRVRVPINFNLHNVSDIEQIDRMTTTTIVKTKRKSFINTMFGKPVELSVSANDFNAMIHKNTD
jgi:hypothetical protein